MTKANHRRKKGKGEKWKLGGITAGILLIIFLVLLAVFHIRTIEVTGNIYLTEQEVKEMIVNDAFTSNSLYLTWKYRNSKPDHTMPSLSAIDVTMISPSHVKIQVYEKRQIGYIKKEQQNIYFDKEGCIVECTEVEKDEIPEITGISIGTPVLYEMLPIENQEVLEEMLEVTQMLTERNLIPDQISFDEQNNMTLTFGDVTVELGQNEYLEEKIINLAGIYLHMGDLAGTLKMDTFTPDTKKVRFQKKEEVATPADAQPQNLLKGTTSSTSYGDTDGTGYSGSSDDSYYGDGTYYGYDDYYGDGTYYGYDDYYGDGTYYGYDDYYGDGTYYGYDDYYGDGTYYGYDDYYGDGTYYGYDDYYGDGTYYGYDDYYGDGTYYGYDDY